MFSFDELVGQVFLGALTTPGFSTVLNKTVRRIESDMDVYSDRGIMVKMEIDSKKIRVWLAGTGHAFKACGPRIF